MGTFWGRNFFSEIYFFSEVWDIVPKNSGFLAIFFWQVFENCFLRFDGNNLRERLLWTKFYVFLTYSDLKKYSLGFLSNFCRQGCPNRTLRVRRNFSRWNFYLEKLINFLSFWKNEWSKCLTFWKKIFGRFLKTAFYVSIGTFWGERLLWTKFYVFLTYSDLKKYSLGFLSNFCRQGCQNRTLCVRRNILKRENFLTYLYVFLSVSVVDRKLSKLCQNVFSRVVKTAFYVSVWNFWGKSFSEILFSFFLKMKNFLNFFQKVFDGVVKSAFRLSKGPFQGKMFFYWTFCLIFIPFEHCAKSFRPSGKKFLLYLENCTLHVHRNFPRLNFYLEKLINFLSFWENEWSKCSTFWKIFFGRVVKTAFDVVIGSFWANFFDKNQILCIILAHWLKLCWLLFDFFPAGLSKMQSTRPEENFEDNSHFWKICFWSLSDIAGKTFGPLEKSFHYGCQISVLRVHRKSLRRNLFWEN